MAAKLGFFVIFRLCGKRFQHQVQSVDRANDQNLRVDFLECNIFSINVFVSALNCVIQVVEKRFKCFIGHDVFPKGRENHFSGIASHCLKRSEILKTLTLTYEHRSSFSRTLFSHDRWPPTLHSLGAIHRLVHHVNHGLSIFRSGSVDALAHRRVFSRAILIE